ncbi:hypothetical protein [Streptomyces nigrescens]|uniref:hypothetical protein n=1 Tax=Streptomyces nigrescens TaxID=1920 RepID=UPI0036FC1BC2
MTDTNDERRERYGRALAKDYGDCWDSLTDEERGLWRRSGDAAMVVADAEQREDRERYREGIRRADEHNNALMDEVQRYADGDERPVLWSVYNQMHLRAANAEAAIAHVRAEIRAIRGDVRGKSPVALAGLREAAARIEAVLPEGQQ